jgi:hypothetical protein
MIRLLRILMLAAMLPVAALSASGDQTYGAGVKLTVATPIQKLYEHPELFVGKTIRVDGVAVSVCEDMGCWLAIGDPVAADFAVRFTVEHSAGIVFPMTAKGRMASAEGVFVKAAKGDSEAADAAKEQQAKHPKAAAFILAYQIKATGTVVH